MEKKYDEIELREEGIDALTKLPNRETLKSKVDQIFNEGIVKVSHGEDCTHSVIMLDIDFFKSINDLYSHLHGDKVLEKVGTILKGYNSDSDIFCLIGRWGGEEFLMMIPYDSKKLAKYVADEIREKVCTHNFSDIGSDLGNQLRDRITLSLGVHYVDLAQLVDSVANSSANLTDKSESDLIELEINKSLQNADIALDYAKFMGRNRVEVLCDEIEKRMNDLDSVRRLYFEYSYQSSEELLTFFKDPYLSANPEICEVLTKHFSIIKGELQQKDTRTQSVFADNLYRKVLLYKDENARKEFMDFVERFVS